MKSEKICRSMEELKIQAGILNKNIVRLSYQPWFQADWTPILSLTATYKKFNYYQTTFVESILHDNNWIHLDI